MEIDQLIALNSPLSDGKLHVSLLSEVFLTLGIMFGGLAKKKTTYLSSFVI